MELDLSEVAAATAGTIFGPESRVSGASIDSRTIQAGQLFIPIIAERDGHDFVESALDRGAAAYLSSQPPSRGSAVVVDDTAVALTALGHAVHSKLSVPTIAITGSVAKTSVKDLTAAALGPSHKVHATPRSFNNELGLPLTLLNAPANTEVLVLEMGARGLGQIRKLTAVAPPSIGIVTAVVMAHTELFGNVEGVATAKAELVEALPATGSAILNANDARVTSMSSITRATVITYGFSEDGAVSPDVAVIDASLRDNLCPSFTLRTPIGTIDIALNVAGMHNAANAAAAAAAALAMGAGLESIAEGLESARLSPSRMAVHKRASGAVVIDDAYNANPTSMRAALDALSALPHTNKVAVLGLMAELGDDERSAHEEIADYAASRKIRLIAVGTDLYGTVPLDEWSFAANELGTLGPHDAVLVKGSLVAGLQALAHHLTPEQA